MRKVEWKNGNKAIIESGHKAFDAYCMTLSVGPVVGGGQWAMSIRSHNTAKNPIDQPVSPGEMQEFDIRSFRNFGLPQNIEQFVRENGKEKSLMVNAFYHYHKGNKTIHGYIITLGQEQNYQLLKMFVTGPTYKSHLVINYAKDFVSNPSV